MRIRAITLGLNLGVPVETPDARKAAQFLEAAKYAFEENGFEVQTTRLATQAFGDLVGARPAHEAPEVAKELERACREQGIEHVSLGTVIPATSRELIPMVPEVIAATEGCFLSVSVAARETGIDLAAIRETGQCMKRIGDLTTGGLGNTRFAALANCPAHIPFFPGGYHKGDEAVFTLGLECADMIQGIFDSTTPIVALRDRLVGALEETASRLEAVAHRLAAEHGVVFGGLDFSTAPFPASEMSSAGALERLGLDAFGAPGTVFAAALTADALRRSRFTKAGYCGVFLPLLEDSVLAARNSEGTYTLDDLLLASAVCGTGLDTIPLPGDISADELGGIVLDVATLAVALDKPLTARLIPMPGKRAGDMVSFDSPYFAGTRVVAPKGLTSAGILSRNEIVELSRR